MTVVHNVNVIEFIQKNSSKPVKKIIEAFAKEGFMMRDIFDSSISDELLEMKKKKDRNFNKCAELISKIRQSFYEKPIQKKQGKTKDKTTYKIHSLEAFTYKAHNELDIKHNSASYAL